MIIRIDDVHSIKFDGNQYILVKSKQVKNQTTEELYTVEDVLGYYPTLDSCLKKLIKVKTNVDNSSIIDLKEYLKIYREMNKKITDLIQEVINEKV